MLPLSLPTCHRCLHRTGGRRQQPHQQIHWRRCHHRRYHLSPPCPVYYFDYCICTSLSPSSLSIFISSPLLLLFLPPLDHCHSFLLGGGGIVCLPFTFSLHWLVATSHLVAPPLPLPLVFTTRCLLLVSSCSATYASCCLKAPLAFKMPSPLVCRSLPSRLPLVPLLVVTMPLVTPLSPHLVLLTNQLAFEVPFPPVCL